MTDLQTMLLGVAPTVLGAVGWWFKNDVKRWWGSTRATSARVFAATRGVTMYQSECLGRLSKERAARKVKNDFEYTEFADRAESLVRENDPRCLHLLQHAAWAFRRDRTNAGVRLVAEAERVEVTNLEGKLLDDVPIPRAEGLRVVHALVSAGIADGESESRCTVSGVTANDMRAVLGIPVGQLTPLKDWEDGAHSA